MVDSNHPNHSTGRRQFLKSLLGLGGAIDVKKAEAATASGSFIWADLRTGQVGFPTGVNIKPGLPGSLMKLVAAAAIRQENFLPANQTIECRGSIAIGKETYTCNVGHGRLDLTQALGLSCNVFFATAAQAISPSAIVSYARKFALDKPVAGFAAGPFPDHPHGDAQHYVLGLTEDLQLHSLQVLQLVALIATRGKCPVLRSAHEQGESYTAPALSLAPAVWDLLDAGMQMACRLGTGRELDPENKLNLAVKTGTAPHGNSFQSWICGYFPHNAPRHAFCARAQSGTSVKAAVPLARKYLFATEWP